MSNPSVTVKMNTALLKSLSREAVEALEKTTEALHTEIVQAQVVPRDKGTLQGEAFAADYSESKSGRTQLVHSTPYARRLYYHPEYNFSKIENPNAKGLWFKDWLPGGKESDFALEAFKKFYKELTGI